mgnify:CR=1 FL=1
MESLRDVRRVMEREAKKGSCPLMFDRLEFGGKPFQSITSEEKLDEALAYANVLKAAMKMYLNHHKQKAQRTHGKTSVKKLVGEGVGASSIEITDGNIKSFERVAKKYNVDLP